MLRKYTYPGVGVSSTARITSTVIPDRSDTSVLFMPIISKIGPENTIIRVHDLDEYVSYYGTPDFSSMGITTQYITRWLNNGGTLYTYRMIDPAGNYNESTFSLKAKDETDAANVVESDIISFKSKYNGVSYNNITLQITPTSTNTDVYNVVITMEGFSTLTEQFSRIAGSSLMTVLNSSSNLITDLIIDLSTLSKQVDVTTTRTAKLYDLGSSLTLNINSTLPTLTVNDMIYNGKTLSTLNIVTSKFTDNAYNTLNAINKYNRLTESVTGTSEPATYYELIYKYFKQSDDIDLTGGKIFELLYNIAATTIDNIVDTGWDDALKLQVFNSCWRVLDETGREDFAVVFSDHIIEERYVDGKYVADGKIKKPVYSTKFGMGENTAAATGGFAWNGIPYTYILNGETEGMTEGEGNNGWFTVWKQYGIVTDAIYNNNADLYVPTTLGYINNVVYNDLNYSMHVPTAGEIYGRLGVFKTNSISENPNAQTKDEWFKNRYNYIEQSTRNMDIMTNRTFYHPDSFGAQSALDFTNNVRVKNKMVRDIRGIMRRYLYQYADGDTLSRCTNECMEYINGWVTNKALTAGSIVIQLDEFTDEYVNANMSIKFRNCIEFINVSIYMD